MYVLTSICLLPICLLPSLSASLSAPNPRLSPPAPPSRSLLFSLPRHIRREDVPGVPGAFVVTGALTAAECRQLSGTAEHMGFMPDHPVGQERPTGIDACEWLADDGILGTLFERVRPHLPPLLPAAKAGKEGAGPAGGAVAGINARWRLFRYGPGAVYRPHIDGSWVGSGIDAGTGEYVHDPFGDRRSRLTCLVYLNEGFDGGSTTFYIPAAGGAGLEARGVKPQAGAVLFFPQGNTASLVHEGSEVTRGCKYVIRTGEFFKPVMRVAGVVRVGGWGE